MFSFQLTPNRWVRRSMKPKQQAKFAKAPTSEFDLDALEAFEAELDWQEKINIDTVESCFDNHDEELNWISNPDYLESLSKFVVPERLNDKRIDSILSEMQPGTSRSQCGHFILNGKVGILSPDDENKGRNPTIVNRKAEKLVAGTTLYVNHVAEDFHREIIAQNLPLNILYEDEHMIVLNKAAGMVVHPGVGNWEDTVVNALAYYLANNSPYGSGDFIDTNGKVISNVEDSSVEGTDGEAVTFRPGIVHRLDKGTTGILVVAKKHDSLSALSKSFAQREVKKTYVAIAVGNPGKRVIINKPIGRHPIHRQRMRVVPCPSRMNSSGKSPNERRAVGVGRKSKAQQGRNALSFVNTLAFDGKLSVAQVRIETGRTHQIRVHLQDRTTPIYGDDVYGFKDWNKRLEKSQGIKRPLLHSFRLELNHPINGTKMTFCAPMTEDMAKVAKNIWPEGPEERRDLFEASEVEMR